MKVTLEQLKKIIEEEMAAEELEEANTRPLYAAPLQGQRLGRSDAPRDMADGVAGAQAKTRKMDQKEIERHQAMDQKTRPIAGVSAGGFVVSRPKVNESLLKKLIREELEEKKVLQDPTIDDLYRLIDEDEIFTDGTKTDLKNKLKGVSLSDIASAFKEKNGWARLKLAEPDLKLGKGEIKALVRFLEVLGVLPPMPPNLKNKS